MPQSDEHPQEKEGRKQEKTGVGWGGGGGLLWDQEKSREAARRERERVGGREGVREGGGGGKPLVEGDAKLRKVVN